jgi:hypothetical protein
VKRVTNVEFHAVRRISELEQPLVSQEGLWFMQLVTNINPQEKGGGRYLQNVGVHLQDYTVSKSRKTTN